MLPSDVLTTLTRRVYRARVISEHIRLNVVELRKRLRWVSDRALTSRLTFKSINIADSRLQVQSSQTV